MDIEKLRLNYLACDAVQEESLRQLELLLKCLAIISEIESIVCQISDARYHEKNEDTPDWLNAELDMLSKRRRMASLRKAPRSDIMSQIRESEETISKAIHRSQNNMVLKIERKLETLSG
ncbi:hypothetical protein B0T14DRAFT_563953 [Immersiella caudata]|uniref:Uncharacterized protein n=1 Tax=Immersiella caudata TaxID=314043 RepID=A0AA40C2K1_9PEZI|nr:hypothetical protein B0T14DRAFT_563953 [Immersiella caudata]